METLEDMQLWITFASVSLIDDDDSILDYSDSDA